jgi:hypothetical protein
MLWPVRRPSCEKELSRRTHVAVVLFTFMKTDTGGVTVNIKIKIGELSMDAELNDTPTARKIADALPLSCSFNTWGDEIYFAIPVTSSLDDSAKEEVQMGDLGYWPTGKAFCVFFGATPVSPPGKIVPASAVNIIGKVLGDAKQFKDVMNARQVTLERA